MRVWWDCRRNEDKGEDPGKRTRLVTLMRSLLFLYGEGRRKKCIKVNEGVGRNPSQMVIHRHAPFGVELREVPEVLRDGIEIGQVDRVARRAGHNVGEYAVTR